MPKYINADQFLADESEAFMNAQVKLARAGKNITYQINEVVHQKIQRLIADAPDEDVEPVVYCKDCIKHNIDTGDFKEEKAGKNTFFWKDEACPFIPYRGKAQEHEFDYQYCVYGKRMENC